MDKPLVVVMTPDRNTDAAVRRAFDADGSTHSMSVATIVINGTYVSDGTLPSLSDSESEPKRLRTCSSTVRGFHARGP